MGVWGIRLCRFNVFYLFLALGTALACTFAFAEDQILTVDNYEKLAKLPKKKRPKLGEVQYATLPDTTTEPRTSQIGFEDVLWAARMIDDEGGGNDPENGAALLWTLLQRGWCPPSRSVPSFKDQFRAFSQPINPLWRCESGTTSRCAQFCGFTEDYIDPKTLDCGSDFKVPPIFSDGKIYSQCGSHPCAKHRLNERDNLSTRPWHKLSKGAREVAVKWALGQLPNPVPGAVDWVNNCSNGKQTQIPDESLSPPKAANLKTKKKISNPEVSIYLVSYRAGGAKVDESDNDCKNLNSLYANKCTYGDKTYWSNQWPIQPVTLNPPDYMAVKQIEAAGPQLKLDPAFMPFDPYGDIRLKHVGPNKFTPFGQQIDPLTGEVMAY